MNITAIVVLMLSAYAGLIAVWVFRWRGERYIRHLLSFCGAYVFTICFADLIPSIKFSNNEWLGWIVVGGFLFQLLLDFISGGIEHGHVHPNGANKMAHWSLLTGLVLHSFFEGMPLASKELAPEAANSLLMGIALHNIPVSVVLITYLMHEQMRRIKVFMLTTIFAVSAPMGMLSGHILFSVNWLNAIGHQIALALVTGIFLHISTTILYESDKNHHFNRKKVAFILLGVAVAVLLHLV